MAENKNGYELSRSWFDFCFENPELISPNHSAIFFFAIEHCNRLGWKEKFGFPTQMTMDAIGIKKHQTYIKYFNELVEWGFFILVQKSSNQYSANIISLSVAMPKNGKALDKAFIKHGAKQTQTNGQSTGQSNSSIDKQETINKEPVVDEEENTQAVFFKNNFRSSKTCRLLIEKEKFSDEQISDHVENFIAQKDAFDKLKHKTFGDLCENFYYWVLKRSKSPPLQKEKSSAQKEKVDKTTQIINNGHEAINIIRQRGQAATSDLQG